MILMETGPESQGGLNVKNRIIRNKAYIKLMLMVLLALFTVACGQKAGDNADSNKPGISSNVAFPNEHIEEIYKKNNCLSCHGAGLGGRVGPETNLEHVGSRLSKEQIMQQISKGSRNMPGYEKIIPAEDIEAVAEWLASLK